MTENLSFPSDSILETFRCIFFTCKYHNDALREYGLGHRTVDTPTVRPCPKCRSRDREILGPGRHRRYVAVGRFRLRFYSPTRRAPRMPPRAYGYLLRRRTATTPPPSPPATGTRRHRTRGVASRTVVVIVVVNAPGDEWPVINPGGYTGT